MFSGGVMPAGADGVLLGEDGAPPASRFHEPSQKGKT